MADEISTDVTPARRARLDVLASISERLIQFSHGNAAAHHLARSEQVTCLVLALTTIATESCRSEDAAGMAEKLGNAVRDAFLRAALIGQEMAEVGHG